MTGTMESTTQGFKLSSLQSHLWEAQRQGQPFAARCSLRIEGPLDVPRLRQALAKTLGRHEILRTTFSAPRGVSHPYQVIRPEPLLAWKSRQGGEVEQSKGDARLASITAMAPRVVSDLEHGPLLTVTYTELAAENHLLVLLLPALCADTVSLKNLVRELATAYEGSQALEALAEPLQYADISRWLDGLRESEDFQEARAFWDNPAHLAFDGLRLPTEKEMDPASPFVTETLRLDLGHQTLGNLENLAAQTDCPLSTYLLAGWHILLQRLTGQRELVVGTRFDGRNSEALEEAIGLFARFLPIAAQADDQATFAGLAGSLRERVEDAREWEEYFTWDLLTADGKRTDMPSFFPFLFEYEASSLPLRSGGLVWSVIQREAVIDRFKLALRGVRTQQGLSLVFSYATACFSKAAVNNLAEKYATLMAALLSRPQAPIGSLSMLGESERRLLLERFGARETLIIPDGSAHSLFEAQAGLHADRAAVVLRKSDGTYRQWSYAQLSERAYRVARVLVARAAAPEDRIGILGESTPETIAGILGILKAGAAYVPMSTHFTRDRLAFMARDAGMKLILAPRALSGHIDALDVPVLILEDLMETPTGETPAALRETHPRQLAYVIYTSGSTGQPKGVGISHGALCAYVGGLHQRLDLREQAQMASPASLATDLGNTALFGALCSGRTLRLLREEAILDAEALAADLEAHPLHCLKMVPNHLNALLSSARPERLIPRECLILGGDLLDGVLVRRVRELRPSCRIVNHYGPTETTVGVATFAVEPAGELQPTAVPIGKPLANIRLRVLDEQGRLVPISLSGELAIGGDLLARGYWGDPALTATKFVPDPFADQAGARLYRTGDLARYRPDGNLEFLGRNDHQVKIRGYRIELGEVETALRACPGLRDAVVIARADGEAVPGTGEKRLVAYVIPKDGAAPDNSALRDFLRTRLAEFAVPAKFVSLEHFPMKANGKVDRGALPDPDVARVQTPYEAPRTEIETILTEIWREVLRVDSLGIQDNFFALGGDSIMTIQVVARARRHGIQIKPKMIFDHQTVAALATQAVTAPFVEAEQGPITGEVPLLPIQKRFFTVIDVDRHHYNQSLLLEVDDSVDRQVLAEALAVLPKHHDALRARFRSTESGWQQTFEPDSRTWVLEHEDLSATPVQARAQALERAATEVQAGLDLTRGPLIRAVRFEMGPDECARLLLVMHHLVVDGVSWRLLVEDLAATCARLRDGLSPELPAKTSSVKAWATQLHALAGSEALQEERAFWLDLAKGPDRCLPRDLEGRDTDNLTGTAHSVTVSLTEAETEALLRQLPMAYGTEINDALLTALALAVTAWTGHTGLFVELEGHGREELFEDVDLSRTVGWFTSRFPVYLQLPEDRHPGACLKAVKEQLRTVPRHGLSYGILRFLSEDEETAAALSRLSPEISFNYLGQLDQALPKLGPFRAATEPSGATGSPRQRRPSPLAISGLVSGGCLRLNLVYSDALHRKETISSLAQGFAGALKAMAALAREPRKVSYSLSDFPEAPLTQDELDTLVDQLSADDARDNIETITAISPLQHGMLYHTKAAPGSGIYVVQFACDLIGRLEVDHFRTAWDRVVERFDIFRGLYLRLEADQPLLVIRKRVTLPWHVEDLRSLSEAEREAHFERYRTADRTAPFDFAKTPPMRMALFRTDETRFRFLWCYHHVCSDGWSTPIVVQSLLTHYFALLANDIPQLPPAPSYQTFISWLLRQDRQLAVNFWQKYLKGFREPIRLKIDPGQMGPKTMVADRHFLHLSTQFTDALQDLARQNRMTANIICQAAWALLLAHHSGQRDVVFGCVVSGRPSDLKGVEHMVGPFVNSQPVRVDIDPDAALLPWLTSMFKVQAERDQFGHLPLVQIKQCSDLKGSTPLFEHLYQFQNYPLGHELARTDPNLGIVDVQHYDYNNYPLTLVISMRADFTIQLMCNPDRIDPATAKRLMGHYRILMEGLIASPAGRIGDLLALLEEADRQAHMVREKELKTLGRKRLKTVRRKIISGNPQGD